MIRDPATYARLGIAARKQREQQIADLVKKYAPKLIGTYQEGGNTIQVYEKRRSY